MTIRLTTTGWDRIAIGTLLGGLHAVQPLRTLAAVYIDFIRGTPPVQIFRPTGLPQLLSFPMPRLTAAISACFRTAAHVAEIVRATYNDSGAKEAALSLGCSNAQVMRYIILPQAFKRIIPPLGNEFIAMLKDSSLVSVIALEELVRRANIVITRTYRPFEIWLGVAFMYLIMTLAISRLVAYMERKLKVDV